MFIEIFGLLFTLALVFIFLSYYRDVEILRIVGFTIMFILSLVVMNVGSSGIEYHDGDIIVMNATNVEVTPQYSSYTSHTIGYILAVMSVVGFATVWWDRRSEK